MGKQEVPKPLLIALIVVVAAAAAYFVLGKSSDSTAPAPPPPPVTPATGATGEPTGPSSTADKKTAAELRAERRQKLREQANAAGLPLDVFMARKRGKVVLILFYEPRGQVDQRVDEAVVAVRGGSSKVVVFRERISNKSRYDGIAEAAKVTGTPAIVVIYKDRAALIEGYIDAAALKERIAQIVNP